MVAYTSLSSDDVIYTCSVYHAPMSNNWVSIESSFDRILASFLTTHAKVCPIAILV